MRRTINELRRVRPDPQPPGWEIPLLIVTTWAAAAAAALLAGRALAGLIFGEGWTWPTGARLGQAVAGLVAGHVRAGLTPGQAARLPAPGTVWATVAMTEAILISGSAWLAVAWWRWRGPFARQGMAGHREVDAVLGPTHLRHVRKVVRPDLHRFEPHQVGWFLGRSVLPRARHLWVPYDRTTGVYGAQGSGKTLDLLTPALLNAPGAALVTLTKLDDLLLTVDQRADGGRPVAVLDPFGTAPGLPELVWDPVAGCVDPMLAERRAKAFTAGTVKGAVAYGTGDDAARFYAAEAAKVLQAFFHAAALTGRTLNHILQWVADPRQATEPEEILRTHPHAAPLWDGLLRGALQGDERTASNTATTVQQAMSLFFQPQIRQRCVPGPHRPATNITDLLARRGTVYLLGRDDPYAPASPLMTAVAEHILDTALAAANASPHGRLCPPLLACLDELPSTTPLPTLRTRMANERALGLSFIYAAQTWRQLVICYGEDEARALFGLTNNIVIFGGGKDGHFYQEISDLLGHTRISRTSYSSHGSRGRTTIGEDTPVLRPEEIRRLPERHALVVAENSRPLLARLTRCIDGRTGRTLLASQHAARQRVAATRRHTTPITERTHDAVTAARRLGLAAPETPDRTEATPSSE